MRKSPDDSLDASRDPGNDDERERAEALFADCIDKLNAGEGLDIERVLAEHPDIGPEVIRQLEAFEGMEATSMGEFLGTLGDYTLRRQIGRGGMGVVYEAWENSMDRRVALKVLPSGFAADSKAFVRFMREAKTAGQLSHPNVVPVYAVGVKEQTPYYAMEFLEGETLGEILRRMKSADSAGPANPFGSIDDGIVYFGRIAQAFAGVAEGLQHAHSKGVIHRDIKPSNLILDPEGRLRILDFGLARLEGQETLTQSGDFLGTVLYMSPEQAMAKRIPIDHRTDIYSLGATMYEALARRPPFQGKNQQDTLSRIILNDPEPLRRMNPGIPRDLETIVLKCLRKSPADRYGTAEALAQDLRRFVRGDPIEARPQPGWERLARVAWRQRTRLAAVACALLLLAMSGFFIWDRIREDYRERNARYERTVRVAASRMLMGQLASRQDVSGGGMGPGTLHDLLGARPGLHPVDVALEELKLATDLFPRRVEAHYYRARGNVFLGHDRQAAEDLARALDCDPEFVPALLLQAGLRARTGEPAQPEPPGWLSEADAGWGGAYLAAHRALAEKRYADASAAYGTLIRMEREGREPYLGSGIDARMGQGIALLEAGDFRGAIRDFVVAGELWPGHPEPALFLGMAYYLAGKRYNLAADLHEAEKILAGLYADSGRADETALAIAAVYRHLGGHDRAVAWAETIQDEYLRTRSLAIILCSTGSVVANAGRAVAAGMKALLARPDDPQLCTYLRSAVAATPYVELSPHRSACERLVAENPENPSAIVLLGNIEHDFKNYAEAFRLYERAIVLDEKNVDAHLSLCLAYSETGQPGRYSETLNTILTDLSPAIEQEEELPWYARLAVPMRDNRADWAYRYAQLAEDLIMTQRNNTLARELCERALELDPRSLYAHMCLGLAHLNAGENARAAEICEGAMKICPEPVTCINLAVARRNLREYKAALEALQVAFDLHPAYRRTQDALVFLLHRFGGEFDEDALEKSVKLVGHLAEAEERPAWFGRILYALAKALSGNPRRDACVEEALRLARLGVDESRRQAPGALAAVGELLRVEGDLRQAIVFMEESLTKPRSGRKVVEDLATARKSYLPGLASYASADEALSGLDRRELVEEGAEWRFFRGKTEPSGSPETSKLLEWTRPRFDDGGWETGRTGFGYGDDDDATVLEDMRGGYTTLYIRKRFTVPDPGVYHDIVLSVRADDAFVAYINGNEVGYLGVPRDKPVLSHDECATAAAREPLFPYDIRLDPGCLLPGENVMALQGLNQSLTSSDFSLIPVLAGQVDPSPDRDRRLLEAFRATVEDDEDENVLAYLKGRILQRAGEYRQAADIYRELAKKDDRQPEPHLRIAECLRDAGDPASSIAYLRGLLSMRFPDDRALWDLWLALALDEAGGDPAKALAQFPRGDIEEGGADDGTRTKAQGTYAADVHWLLEALAAGEAIRVNCGGLAFRDPSGETWGRDRFFNGGGLLYGAEWSIPLPFPGEISGTDNDRLYQTERFFPEGDWPPPGYRFPLRPGRYRVTLHFADVYFGAPGKRRFHVDIEGKRVLDDYDPCANGHATADPHTFDEIIVSDGSLDLSLLRVIDNPKISGIEIERRN